MLITSLIFWLGSAYIGYLVCTKYWNAANKRWAYGSIDPYTLGIIGLFGLLAGIIAVAMICLTALYSGVATFMEIYPLYKFQFHF